MSRVNVGSIILVDDENKYHDWVLYDLSRNKGMPLRNVDITENELGKLRYMRIVDKKEIINLNGTKNELLQHVSNIKKINRKSRVLVIPARDKETRKAMEKLFFGENIITFPPLKDYKDKEKTVNKIIDRWKLKCETVEVRKTLVKNMIRDVHAWENVLVLWETLSYRGEELTASDIDELFPDNEFYNLNQFIHKMLEGKIKRKSIKMGYYFLDTKMYSARWVMQKIREETNMLGVVYQAYRGGVLLVPDNRKRLTERIGELDWTDGMVLGDLKEYQQRQYLRLIEKIPYKYFLTILPIIYRVPEFAQEKDIYHLIEDLRCARGHYENGE